jgi:hypothetical protein
MEMERERPAGQLQRERERQQELQLLRRKNAELAMQTKKLEEKVRSLEKVRDSFSSFSSLNKKELLLVHPVHPETLHLFLTLTSVPSRQKSQLVSPIR